MKKYVMNRFFLGNSVWFSIYNIFKIHCILLWNTFKILPRHRSISINRLFTSAMETNFEGKRSMESHFDLLLRLQGQLKPNFAGIMFVRSSTNIHLKSLSDKKNGCYGQFSFEYFPILYFFRCLIFVKWPSVY
jgi:hypothetical protein